MVKGICLSCKKERDVTNSGRCKGFCHVCYKREIWKPKLTICKRCKREKPMHSKGLCDGCYNSVFHIEKVKKSNTQKLYGLDYEKYQNIIKNCVICGFDKIVDLHHLDYNNKNNVDANLVGLCPNHHRMVHRREFSQEMYELLKDKGLSPKPLFEKDEIFKK